MALSLNFVLMFVGAVHAFQIAKGAIPQTSRPWYSRWYGLLSYPIAFFVCVVCFRSFVYEPFRMPSASMHPSIPSGSVMVAKKLGYGNYGTYGFTLLRTKMANKLERGDVVVFEFPLNRKILYVKRLIGLPGDEVEMRNRQVVINGKPLDQQKVGEEDKYEIVEESVGPFSYRIALDRMHVSRDFEMTVPEGHYFVMGDNRDHSNDSRYWGFVPESHISGTVVSILGNTATQLFSEYRNEPNKY